MPSFHVLVAEDDHHLATLLRRTLEIDGFKVTVAIDGQEALDKVEAHYPDLVILDAMMPIVDGFKVLESLRSNPNHRRLPILMLTAMRSEAGVRRAISSGASDYLTKPFRPDQLLQRVRRLLEGESVRTRVVIDL